MKNNCCLFERLFKIENGCFQFGISFFISEILTFLYYANWESDDIIMFPTYGKILDSECLWK